MWYGRREEVRQAGLPFRVVRDAYLNLLPSDQFEERDLAEDNGQGPGKRKSRRKGRRTEKQRDETEGRAHDDSNESEPESEMAEEDNEVAEETEVLAVSKEKQKEAKAMFQILLLQHSGIKV